MATEKRKSDPSLEQRLFEQFYRFSFFRAVDLLESLSAGKKRLGRTLEPGQEAVRFSVKPGLAFPPSDISRMDAAKGNGPVSMQVTFMGLHGPAGVLPHWFSELIEHRLWKRDRSLVEFLDLFHHRLISLFFLAWKKYRLAENYRPHAEDRYSKYLLSLIGLGTGQLTGKIHFPIEALVFYSGRLSRTVQSAEGLKTVVEYLTGVGVDIEQFVERRIPLVADDCTCLGRQNHRLGTSALCGTYVWECQTKFRVHLGPIAYDRFHRFLPGGRMHAAVFTLVRLIAGIEFEFDLVFYLKRKQVPGCVLGAETKHPPRLGWTSWIKSPGFEHSDHPGVLFVEATPAGAV